MKITFEVSLPKPQYNEHSHDAARKQAERELEQFLDRCLQEGFAVPPYTTTIEYQESDSDDPNDGVHYWLVTIE